MNERNQSFENIGLLEPSSEKRWDEIMELEKNYFASLLWRERVDGDLNEIDEDILKDLGVRVVELVGQMREQLTSGEYALVIGDDASGRLPARMIHRILSNVAEERHLPTPKILFVAGFGSENSHSTDKDVQKKEADLLLELHDTINTRKETGRALVVTDIIATGKSLYPTAKTLRTSGLSYDFATLNVLNTSEKQELEEYLSGKVYSSPARNWAPGIYSESRFSGVTKDPKQLRARRVTGEQKTVTMARKFCDVLADRIAHDLTSSLSDEKPREA